MGSAEIAKHHRSNSCEILNPSKPDHLIPLDPLTRALYIRTPYLHLGVPLLIHFSLDVELVPEVGCGACAVTPRPDKCNAAALDYIIRQKPW